MTEPSELRFPVSPETKHWFGNRMQLIAIMHDLAGPDISLVELERYRNEVAAEICRGALAAHATGKLVLELADLDALCQSAAEELIGIRQIRNAHAQGKLPTQTLKRLPAYTAFQQYFDEDPHLVWQGVAAALAQQEERPDGPSASLPHVQVASNLPGTKKSFSVKTEQWLETQVLAFAIAEDMADKPSTNVDDNKYACDSAQCFWNNIHHAIQIGNLTIARDDVDDLCRHAAAKVLKLRQLKVAFANGQISRQKLKKFPEYQKYREYLEQAPVMGSLMSYAAILHEALDQHGKAKKN